MAKSDPDQREDAQIAASPAPKCECDQLGELRSGYDDWYDAETELPFVNHAPGECKCVNELALYRSKGAVRWLCSCCCMLGDVRLADGEAA